MIYGRQILGAFLVWPILVVFWIITAALFRLFVLLNFNRRGAWRAFGIKMNKEFGE